MSTQHTEGKRGFTLVELIVSIGLFIIVLTIVASAYLSLISLNRKARATNDLVSNLSYVVESMSRTIRTGTNYQCGGLGGTNCASPGNSTFSFTDDQTRPVTFSLVGGAIDQSVSGQPLDVLTDPRITITNLIFYVDGVGTGDQKQPRVLFTISGTIKPDTQTATTSFSIESSATQRLIEL
ncbi:MAG: seg [Parcubacteria group bacterium]|nr:seg [Parcubacteria group bacterium]